MLWHPPIRVDKFKITQKFLNPDKVNYPKTGHHPGVDYGTQGELSVPLYFCADGEIIETGVNQFAGNYFYYYIPEVDRTLVYFHLKFQAPPKGYYKTGGFAGFTGNTGLSTGPHLHLECMKGKKTSTDRVKLYTSLDALKAAAEDADILIRKNISG